VTARSGAQPDHVDDVNGPGADEAVEDGGEESVTDLVEELARNSSRLVLWEATLAASQRVPEMRRAALAGAGVLGLVLAFAAAFALANWAAVSGLSALVPTWLAALLLALAWLAVGLALVAVLLTRLGRASGIEWWRMVGDDRDQVAAAVQRSRDEAEEAVRDTVDRLSGAIAHAAAAQIAEAFVPFGEAAAGVGEELLEVSEEVVDSIEEQLPGGGAVAQAIDVVLFPGRLGLRIATTVFRSGPAERSG
jgi:Putative Actinobacterial Holin-X, holin superfamily III